MTDVIVNRTGSRRRQGRAREERTEKIFSGEPVGTIVALTVTGDGVVYMLS